MYYLDHNSTTPPLPSVIEVMKKIQEEEWGNPHSFHDVGVSASMVVIKAEKYLKDRINGHDGRIVWTGNGSQANQIAIEGICEGSEDLLASQLSHKSVYDLIDKYGRGDGWKKLLSMIYINNETGAVMDTVSFKHLEKDTLLHIDAVQALGKLNIDVVELNCDLISFSGHKIYGPKGIGCLWVKNGTSIEIPYLGTPNVPGIAGFGEAVRLINVLDYQKELRDKEVILLSEFEKLGVEYKIHETRNLRVPGTLSISFPSTTNTDLMLELSDKEVMVSIGSACTKEQECSRVLKGIGLSEEEINSTIRISLGKESSFTDIFNAAQIISDTVKELRNGT